MKMYGGAEAITLIALALGYIVCHMAKKEDKAMKITGYIIGTFIITLSALHIIISATMYSKICPMGKKMGGIKGQAPSMAMPAAGQQK